MDEYKHILFAADFSPVAEFAARRAARLAACFDARLSLLHVIDYFPEDLPVDWICPENQDPAKYLVARSEELLAQLAGKLPYAPVESKVVFSNRSAAHEIVEFARQEAVDLVVTGSHGRHGISEILGSTASSIAHRLSCDVLTVRQS